MQDNIARADIAVKSVNFSYPSRPNAHIFEDFCVSVKPGKTLALVGPSGCGKTTVVSLLERFYDPLQGSLTLEGVDLRDLNLKWLRSQIGMVSQEPVLFDVSIAENIRYGALSREVSDEEVIEVAKAANIHSFIESLPEVIPSPACGADISCLMHAGLQHQCGFKGHSVEWRTETACSHCQGTGQRP